MVVSRESTSTEVFPTSRPSLSNSPVSFRRCGYVRPQCRYPVFFLLTNLCPRLSTHWKGESSTATPSPLGFLTSIVLKKVSMPSRRSVPCTYLERTIIQLCRFAYLSQSTLYALTHFQSTLRPSFPVPPNNLSSNRPQPPFFCFPTPPPPPGASLRISPIPHKPHPPLISNPRV